MPTFADLATSRRQWIDDTLRPWCATAPRKELLLAELEWQDIAGRPAPEMTLWLWAWGRFPVLVAEGLPSLNETHAVSVRTRDGRTLSGFPDGRASKRGQLVLLGERGMPTQPLSIDEIASVSRIQDQAQQQ